MLKVNIEDLNLTQNEIKRIPVDKFIAIADKLKDEPYLLGFFCGLVSQWMKRNPYNRYVKIFYDVLILQSEIGYLDEF